MSPEAAHSSRATLGHLAALAAGQLALGVLVKSSGFSAISDDDYARVVIAQQFAAQPSWDPSGTSWLPFPFILLGSVMTITSPTLGVAQTVAQVTAILAVMLLYASARVLGCTNKWAILAALFAAALPYAARLSVATVPEHLTASLIVFSASTLGRSCSGGLRLWAGAALFLACASRYEAWPAAIAFALVHILQVRAQSARRQHVGAALLSLSFPAIWMMHGVIEHGSAFFFVKRVVDYKLALGGDGPSAFASALAYPKALLLAEPEITWATLALLFVCVFTRHVKIPRLLLQPWLVLAAVICSLMVSALRSGAPTHHAERALLSIWLFLAPTIALILERTKERRQLCWGAVAAGALFGLMFRFSAASEIEPFVDRSSEVMLGKQVLAGQPPSTPIALALPDYGYFAAMAAAGAPHRFVVLAKHDPREEDKPHELRKWLSDGGCLYVTHSDFPRGLDEVLDDHHPPLEFRRAAGCKGHE